MASPRRTAGFLSALLTICGLAGCSTQQPLISHAHVGHALTTWHDTPDRQGLVAVAAADLEVAEREARSACADPRGPTTRRHAANLLNALVPEAHPDGPGSGYGALRAVMGTVEHLEFAATSADASLNLVAAIADLSVQGEAIHARLEVATELAQTLLQASAQESPQLCRQLLNAVHVALHGDGSPGERSAQTIGFRALYRNLLETLERETDPAYEPVPRRYVLGLVRLPTGEWRYRLPQQHRHETPVFTGYGY